MKKHRILKIFLLILLLILVLFIIHTIRNYIIISNIYEKELPILDKDNFTYTKKMYNEDEPDKITDFKGYKKGNYIAVVSTYPDRTLIIWNDTEANEQIMLIPTTLNAIVTHDSATIIFIPLVLGTSTDNAFGPKLILAMSSLITSEKVNEQDCYCLNAYRLLSSSSNKSWVNKDTGIVIKQENGYKEIEGKKYYSIFELTDYSFDTVTDDDVTKPSLTGYKVTES